MTERRITVFNEMHRLQFDGKINSLNRFEKISRITTTQLTPTTTTTNFSLEQLADKFAGFEYLDVKESFLHIEFDVGAQATRGVVTLSPCAGIGWCKDYSINLNDVNIDNQRDPVAFWRVIAQFASKEWLDTVGRRAGLFLNKYANDKDISIPSVTGSLATFTVANTATLQSIVANADGVLTVNNGYFQAMIDGDYELQKWSDDCIYAASGTMIVGFDVPLSLLSKAFDHTITGHQYIPCRKLVISGNRETTNSNLVITRSTGAALDETASSFKINLNLCYVKPSDVDLSILKMDTVNYIFPRYTSDKLSYTSATTQTPSFTLQKVNPVACFLGVNRKQASSVDGKTDDFIFSSDMRLQLITSITVELDGAPKPYEQHILNNSATFNPATKRYEKAYIEYLRFIGGNEIAHAPITYREFYNAALIPILLQNKQPGDGINFDFGKSSSLKVDMAITSDTATSVYVITEIVSFISINYETGEITVQNVS